MDFQRKITANRPGIGNDKRIEYNSEESLKEAKFISNRSVPPPEGGKNPKKWCPRGVYIPCGHHFFG